MTEFMAFRGPDATNTWLNENVGFGHTLLRSTQEAESEHQPCSLDGLTWITADARLDGRDDLIQKLKSKDQPDELKKASDAELILRAYHAWGQELVHYLLGDFAFALWDGRHRLLLCARDHFGIKPFYYAHTNDTFIFSNTLNTVRRYPTLSADLDQQAITDFLMCGYNFNLKSTAFKDIRRLAPAHILTVSLPNRFHSLRYWHLPVPQIKRYQRKYEYIDHFRELFTQAVQDRLRTSCIAVLMSGGLDSTAVAATAAAVLKEKFSQASSIHAFNYTCDHLFPDNEWNYARTAAKALGIPISHIAFDADRNGLQWFYRLGQTPEPLGAAMIAGSTLETRSIGKRFRAGLTGQGGDPALHPSPSSLLKFFTDLLTGRLCIDMVQYAQSHKRLPRMGIRTILRHRLRKENKHLQAKYPPWLNRCLSARLNLPDRWCTLTAREVPIDSIRSQAYGYLASPLWTNLFENYDPGVTHFTTELRHPFFDLRLLSFLLALPTIPWCIDKELLRKAMKIHLPETILNRPKTPLPTFPMYALLQQTNIQAMDAILSVQGFDMFVDIDIFKKILHNKKRLRPDESELVIRPLGLAFWMLQLQKSTPET